MQKEEMKPNLSALPLLLLVCSSGCMSSSLHDRITHESHTRREFADFGLEPRTYAGTLKGTTEVGGLPFLEYVFTGPLVENGNRSLVIHVPQDGQGRAIMSEGKSKSLLSTNVTLVLSSTSPHFRGSWISEHYPNANAPSTVLFLNDASLDFGNGRWSLFTRETDSLHHWSGWLDVPIDDQVSWQVRDSKRLRNLRLRYLYTVPIDIVTAPLQVVGGVAGIILYVERGEGRL